MTVPFDHVPLHEQRDLFRRLVDLGYTDAWSAETEGYDAFTPLALASVWAPELRLGTAIVPAFTRGPAVVASSAAALADAAPGRFVLGIGASSNVIVERWNGGTFEKPYEKVRDLLRFLRTAFAGEKAGGGFRLGKIPDPTPPILVAALREGMLRLAGREGDGAILNWLSAEDVRTVAPIVQQASPDGSPREVVARIFVAPTTDTEAVRAAGRRMIAAYLNVPVYAAFHEWLGRGELLQPMWSAWRAGDRQAALEAVPDQVIDEILVHGAPEACREHLARYAANGVTTPMVAIVGVGGVDPIQAMADLAPR
jgi:probable F420-dependent oxidoreductase